MKTRLKNAALKTINHIHDHRGVYCAGAAAFAMVWLHQGAIRDWESFLVEKGIDPDEYFLPDFYQEKMSA